MPRGASRAPSFVNPSPVSGADPGSYSHPNATAHALQPLQGREESSPSASGGLVPYLGPLATSASVPSAEETSVVHLRSGLGQRLGRVPIGRDVPQRDAVEQDPRYGKMPHLRRLVEMAADPSIPRVHVGSTIERQPHLLVIGLRSHSRSHADRL